MTVEQTLAIGGVVGGVCLLARLPNGRYQVRYACCGRVGALSRKQIVTRLRHPQTRCHACASRGPRRPRGFLQDDELAVHPRARAPGAAWILAIYARAEAAVRRRNGAGAEVAGDGPRSSKRVPTLGPPSDSGEGHERRPN
ncbi:hypothetical protein [Thiorhodococcus minor]|uniref:Uncharacterized protein n=1 Tax=Thiorhodococcus minor TaxID=57489 RepID=A0A6M0K7S8_9GAMM|nr:hypothetical protein [Thiorhodococcus minor]NEV64717.1 hypothetical protein [Thiorhodococcus minor]